jgi:rsbT antagonist protein RsbS
MSDASRSQIPVIELWGHLLLSLQGDILDDDLTRVADTLLRRIATNGGEGLIIDASGVWMVDSHLCAALGKLAMAARLMGIPSILCGLDANVVIALQTMGFELAGVETALSLEAALERLGVMYHRNHEHTLEQETNDHDARENERD